MSPRPVVVKLGGSALESGDALWKGLAALHASTPGGVVLVHGGGASVDAQLKRLGLEPIKRDGIRVTPPDQIWDVVGVLAGQVNLRLVGRLLAAGARAVGLSLGDAFHCRSAVTARYGDAGRVGEVTAVDPALLATLLGAGVLPVVSSIGIDDAGEPLNINADDAAVAIAKGLGAAELVLLSDVPGVLDAARSVIPALDPGLLAALVADGSVAGGMIPKVRGALDVSEALGRPVRIAGWGAIREGATLDSLGGTLVTAAARSPDTRQEARR